MGMKILSTNFWSHVRKVKRENKQFLRPRDYISEKKLLSYKIFNSFSRNSRYVCPVTSASSLQNQILQHN